MAKIKTKAEHLHAVVHELARKNEPLQRASLQEADRLMDDREYESAAAWMEEYMRIEGARLRHMSPLNPNSLLGKRPATIAEPSDKAGQTTIWDLCGEE